MKIICMWKDLEGHSWPPLRMQMYCVWPAMVTGLDIRMNLSLPMNLAIPYRTLAWARLSSRNLRTFMKPPQEMENGQILTQAPIPANISLLWPPFGSTPWMIPGMEIGMESEAQSTPGKNWKPTTQKPTALCPKSMYQTSTCPLLGKMALCQTISLI